MKIQIRRHVFETNSSTEHVLVIMRTEEFKKWESGELFVLYNDIINNENSMPKTYTREEALKFWESSEELRNLWSDFDYAFIDYSKFASNTYEKENLETPDGVWTICSCEIES